MKHMIRLISLIMIVGMITFTACKDDAPPPALTLVSLMSGTTDLNGATSATGVVTTENIVATFSTELDATTVTDANFILKRGTAVVPSSITVSGKEVTINPTNDLLTGAAYTIEITAALKSNKGVVFIGVGPITFSTAGVGIDTPPQSSSQVLYVQFNGGIEDLTGNATKSFEQLAYTADRFGVANGAANFRGATAAGNGDLVELTGTKFINANTTISVWYKVNAADYAGGSKFMFGDAVERGYFMEVGGNLSWMKLATSHKVGPAPAGVTQHNFGTAWTDPNGDGVTNTTVLFDYLGSIATLTDGKWVQLVMTYDATNSIKTIFINGAKIMQVDLDAGSTEWQLKNLQLADANDAGTAIAGIENKLALGYACSRGNSATGWAIYANATNTFKGAMDDFRIFSKALTESEVAALYNSEKP